MSDRAPDIRSSSLGGGRSTVAAFVAARGDDTWVVEPRVLVIAWDPVLASSGGLRTTEAFHYQDPHALADGFADDMRAATSGAVSYQLADWEDVEGYPEREDGRVPTEAEWLACLSHPDPGHSPCNTIADYEEIVRAHDVCGRVERGEIDEVWLFGAPWFGFYESRMVGDGAFWTNAPALTSVSCGRRFVMMGFNYERGVAEMLHNVGHRLESAMAEAFRGWAAGYATSPDPFTLFARTDAASPGQAMCGDTHHPANSAPGEEYIYDSARSVTSGCDDFVGWPAPSAGAGRPLSCAEWGCSQQGYLAWLFNHVPRNAGTATADPTPGAPAYQRDWWKYVYAFDTYLAAPAGPTGGSGSSGPAACDALARGDCDARSDCAWFACANRCAPSGTMTDAMCGPLAECTALTDIVSCDANRSRCAWYACANRCYPNTTPLENACPPAGPSCETAGTIEDCSALGRTCAWYACANRCYPNGLPLESACPGAG